MPVSSEHAQQTLESSQSLQTPDAPDSPDVPDSPAESPQNDAALAIEELIIDVRRTMPHIPNTGFTAETCSQEIAGVNIVRHGKRDESPELVIDSIIEGMEKLGITAATYRILREDLPQRIPVEVRTAS